MEYIQDSLFGKMYPEPIAVTTVKILGQSSKKSQRPKFQCLEVVNGQTQEWLELSELTLLGEHSMPSIGSPKDVRESSLSQILEDNVPEKYFLSKKACEGILRRAEKRGKTLPPQLEMALKQQSLTLRAQEHGHQPIVMREVSRTLRAEAGAPKHEADWESLIIEPRSQGGVCRIHKDGIVPTLNTAQGGQRQPCVLAFAANQRDEVRDLGDKAGALQAEPGMKQQTFVATKVYGICSDASNSMKSSNPHSGIYEAKTSKTLDLNGGNPACNQGGVAIVESVAHAVDCRNLCENEELSGTLQCKSTGGYSLNYQNPVRQGYAVRRLTPLECLRLQGFPDDWLDIEGMSDTAKYKAIGNSVAVPCVEFVMSGIARCLR